MPPCNRTGDKGGNRENRSDSPIFSIFSVSSVFSCSRAFEQEIREATEKTEVIPRFSRFSRLALFSPVQEHLTCGQLDESQPLTIMGQRSVRPSYLPTFRMCTILNLPTSLRTSGAAS